MLLGCSGTKEGLAQVPDGIFQRASKLNCVEVAFKRAIAKLGRRYIPGRAGVTTDGVLNNKYRSRCLGRGRCGRGCDVNAAFHSPTALVYPARDSGNVTIRPYSVVSEVFLDEATGKAAGVRVIDANTREVMDFKARVVVLGAGCLDSTRILLNSKSARHPQGMGNSSGLLGCYLSEHAMGPRGSGFIPPRIGTEPTLDDGRPVSPYVPRFRNVTDKHPDFIRGYHFQGGGGAFEYPGLAHDMPGFGKAFKSSVRKYYPALISLGGFGEVLPRKENRVSLDAEVKDAWGIPVLRFDYRFGDNEIKKMAKDMAESAEEMLRAAGAESIKVDKDAAAARLVHPRDRHRAHGRRPEDVGHRPLLPPARGAERVPRRRRALRLRRHAEHDLVDPRHVLADDGLPEGADADGQRLAGGAPGRGGGGGAGGRGDFFTPTPRTPARPRNPPKGRRGSRRLLPPPRSRRPSRRSGTVPRWRARPA